jgi:hypothetical protein
MLQGWQRYKSDPDPRVRERFVWEMEKLRGPYNAALWAMERQLRRANHDVGERVRALRREVEKEFGMAAKMTARLLGPVLLWTTRREEKRLARGKTYEPPTFLERTNWVEA